MTLKSVQRQAWRVLMLALAGMVICLTAGPLAADDPPPAATEDTEASQAVTEFEVELPSLFGGGELTEEQQKEQEKQMQELMRQAEEARRRQEEELRKQMDSPAWRPSHREKAVIEVEGLSLNTFCLNNDGNILAGCGGPSVEWVADPEAPNGIRQERKSGDAEIRVYSPDGSLLHTWPVDVKPEAIAVAQDGTIFIGGDGQMARLDQTGKVLAVADSPVVAAHKESQEEEEVARKAREEAARKEAEKEAEEKPKTSAFRALFNIVTGSGGDTYATPLAEDDAAMVLERIREVNGIAVTGDDVFVCCPMREGYGFAIWRTDRDFQNAEQIVTKLRGCCGQMDISSFGSDVFVCENSRKRVTQYDRDGKTISHFGKSSRSGPDGFGSCCNPMNLCFASNGDVITSESGPPDAVKRFSQDGELVSVVALPKFEGGCLRVTVSMSPDEKQVYVLNTGDNAIHVFADRRYEPTHEQVSEIELKTNDQPAGLHTFSITHDGKLLAACGGNRVSYVRSATGTEAKTIEEASEIRVLSLDGETLETWPVKFMPQAVNVAPNGTVFVGGEGQLAKLSPAGEVLLTADAPNRQSLKELMANIDEEVEARKKQYEAQAKQYKSMAEKMAAQLAEGKQGDRELTDVEKSRLESQKRQYEMYAKMMEQQIPRAKDLVIMSAKRKMRVSGVAVTDKDVFVCCSAVQGYGFDVYRMTHDLTDAVKIVEGLRGCCGQMDIQAFDGGVWAAENSRGRVVGFDREGKEIASWGKKDRKSVEGFGSCCNPMNLWFGADGVVYTSEASIGRIKRFTPDGKFLGLVGTAGVVPGCKNVAITVSPDGKTVCMLDITRSRINVFKERKEEAAEKAVAREVEDQAEPGVFGGIF